MKDFENKITKTSTRNCVDIYILQNLTLLYTEYCSSKNIVTLIDDAKYKYSWYLHLDGHYINRG